MSQERLRSIAGFLIRRAAPNSTLALESKWRKCRKEAARASRRREFSKIEGHLQSALEIAQELGEIDPKLSRSLFDLAAYYESTGTYSQAEIFYNRALELYDRTRGPEHLDTLSCLNDLALLYYTTGEFEKAEPLYQRLVPILEKTRGPHHKELAVCLENKAAVMRKLGRPEQSQRLLERAKAIRLSLKT